MIITLKTLPEATAQQVFDQVATHLLTQMRVCKTDDGCRYRNDGLKCAAGCLIADDEYEPEMENVTWDDLVREGVVNGFHEGLITSLQYIHDQEPPVAWKSSLKKLANRRNLNTEVLHAS